MDQISDFFCWKKSFITKIGLQFIFEDFFPSQISPLQNFRQCAFVYV